APAREKQEGTLQLLVARARRTALELVYYFAVRPYGFISVLTPHCAVLTRVFITLRDGLHLNVEPFPAQPGAAVHADFHTYAFCFYLRFRFSRIEQRALHGYFRQSDFVSILTKWLGVRYGGFASRFGSRGADRLALQRGFGLRGLHWSGADVAEDYFRGS